MKTLEEFLRRLFSPQFGKHSASGEARYSVTFKETETDSPAIGIRGLPALHRHP